MSTWIRFSLLVALLAVLLQVPVSAHGDNPNPDGGVPSEGHEAGDPAREGIRLVAPAVSHAHANFRGRDGYRIAAADSGVFSYGAPFLGNLYTQGVDPRNLQGPVFDILVYDAFGARPGYWLFATDGGVFSFRAPFFGSAAGQVPAGAKVNHVVPSVGGGYEFSDTESNVWRCQGTCVLLNPPINTPAPPTPPRPRSADKGRATVGSDGTILSLLKRFSVMYDQNIIAGWSTW